MQNKTSGAVPCISLTLTYVNLKSSRENHKHYKRAANSAGKIERTVGKLRTVSLLKSEPTQAVKNL